MLVAGEGVEPMVAWMNAHGFDAKVLGRPARQRLLGQDAALGDHEGHRGAGCRILVAAERQGILKEVMGCLGDVDATSFSGSLAMLAQTHVVHAAAPLGGDGPGRPDPARDRRRSADDEAIEKSHRRTVDAHIAPADGKVPPLDEALKLLSEKVVRGR